MSSAISVATFGSSGGDILRIARPAARGFHLQSVVHARHTIKSPGAKAGAKLEMTLQEGSSPTFKRRVQQPAIAMAETHCYSPQSEAR